MKHKIPPGNYKWAKIRVYISLDFIYYIWIVLQQFQDSLTHIDEVVRQTGSHYFSLQHTVLIPHTSSLQSLRETAKSYTVWAKHKRFYIHLVIDFFSLGGNLPSIWGTKCLKKANRLLFTKYLNSLRIHNKISHPLNYQVFPIYVHRIHNSTSENDHLSESDSDQESTSNSKSKNGKYELASRFKGLKMPTRSRVFGGPLKDAAKNQHNKIPFGMIKTPRQNAVAAKICVY